MKYNTTLYLRSLNFVFIRKEVVCMLGMKTLDFEYIPNHIYNKLLINRDIENNDSYYKVHLQTFENLQDQLFLLNLLCIKVFLCSK